MSDTYPNKPLEHYYYGEQIYNYALQFMSIFSGMQVSIGKNDRETSKNTIYVPIRYGPTDRTVEWILSSQTANKPIRLPMMSTRISGLELEPSLRKGMRQESAKTHLPRGASLPDGLKVIRQMNPNPCRINFELSVITSNTRNRFEIMEQILILFDPDIQIFTSDDFKDHYKISRVELYNISLDDEYPMGNNSSVKIDTYQFMGIGYFRPPVDLKESYVKSIRLRLDAISDLPVNEAVVELNTVGNTGTVLFDIDDLDIPEN